MTLAPQKITMHDINRQLAFINDIIYAPNNFAIVSFKEEAQNAEYAGCVFELSNGTTVKSIRFRVAKITPTKIGQFVTFWEKDAHRVNQPYLIDTAPDLLVITAFSQDGRFGQFVFPKDILLKKNILKSQLTKGKMGMRIYSSWDRPVSKAAIHTQGWQLSYFFEINKVEPHPTQKILALYAQ